MELKKKKEELVAEFNRVNQQLSQLATLREQLRGKLIMLEELEKIGAAKEQHKKDSKK